jgi:hypothetical protein
MVLARGIEFGESPPSIVNRAVSSVKTLVRDVRILPVAVLVSSTLRG